MSDINFNHPEELLTPKTCRFLKGLHQTFESRRQNILEQRKNRQKKWDQGYRPEISQQWSHSWLVAPAPHDLEKRFVEITGPVDRKMIIHGLNSGADVFMADFEDATSPRWNNIIQGHYNIFLAVHKNIDFTSEGKSYALLPTTATLKVRPRGWHLVEQHVRIDKTPMSASLFDFGLFFFHNAQTLLSQGSGPYLYLPKLESAEEARLWNDVFQYAQQQCNIPYSSVRATVLIETLPAAFEMEGILHELKDHISGLNAGRWDYIFSFIKRQQNHPQAILPDRQSVSMTVPFMKAYTDLLVQTCHKHGAHAIGGMSAFIPNRKNPHVTAHALHQVRQDKKREVSNGFDGTWVAHPDLVPVARTIFEDHLQRRLHQKNVCHTDLSVRSADLLSSHVPNGSITEKGIRENIRVSLQYLQHWLHGSGAVALNNLMEDAATAEISRSQLWQWCHHHATIQDGRIMTLDLYQDLLKQESQLIPGLQAETIDLLKDLVCNSQFEEFLTIPASRYLHSSFTTNHLL